MNSEDFLAIQNLEARYGHAIDDGDLGWNGWDVLSEIFTEDAIFDMDAVNFGVLSGLAAIKSAMSKGVHPLGHHVTNLVIEQQDDDHATCRMKLIAILADGRASTGTYSDRLVRTHAGWRIEHRAVTLRAIDMEREPPFFAKR